MGQRIDTARPPVQDERIFGRVPTGAARFRADAADPTSRLSSPHTPTSFPYKEPAMLHAPPCLSRRRFLTTAASGRLGGAAAFHSRQGAGKDGVAPPSEKIIVGGIGIGNRGGYDLGCFLQQPDVRFVAVCDVKAKRREAVKKMVDAKYGNAACAAYRDLRELLARNDIDAVLIATGPNWHATATMLAANAGKDVYCEKPCTKNIAQSLILAETFRRTGRIFQAGTQRRNLPHIQFAVELRGGEDSASCKPSTPTLGA